MLYLADVERRPNDGIYQKVVAQARAMSALRGRCTLICAGERGGSFCLRFVRGRHAETRRLPLPTVEAAVGILRENPVATLYLRHHRPTPQLLRLLWQKGRLFSILLVEIPTYPYYYEQLAVSRNKPRTLLRLGWESVCWPMIYRLADRLPVVVSNRRFPVYPKMTPMSNGIDFVPALTAGNPGEGSVLSLVGVGTLYPYHGYDRLIRAIGASGGSVGGRRIRFRIVGSLERSPEARRLYRLAENLGCREQVRFLRPRSRPELGRMLTGRDIGVGALALYRRGADMDTCLKTVEYLCRGMRTLSSGPPTGQSGRAPGLTLVANRPGPLDLEAIAHALDKGAHDPAKLASRSLARYRWETVLRPILP